MPITYNCLRLCKPGLFILFHVMYRSDMLVRFEHSAELDAFGVEVQPRPESRPFVLYDVFSASPAASDSPTLHRVHQDRSASPPPAMQLSPCS